MLAQIPPSLVPDFFQLSALHCESSGFPHKHETSHPHAHSTGIHTPSQPNQEKRVCKATGLHSHTELVWAVAGKAPVLAGTL